MRRHLSFLLLAPGLAVAPAAPASAALPSSTSATVEGSAGPVSATYGQPLGAAAVVTVPGAAPDGWVYVVVDGLSRRTDLAADGTAATTLEGLPVGTHAVSATFVPRDPAAQEGSTSAPVAVEVAKALTDQRLRVTGKRADRVTQVRVRVRTPYGTTPHGKVRLTLHERGGGALLQRAAGLVDGMAVLRLRRLAAGGYDVVVRYSGDPNHVLSREGRRFWVRRR